MQQTQLKKLNRISGADFNFVPADNNGGIGVPIEAFDDYFYAKQVQNLTTATKKSMVWHTRNLLCKTHWIK